MKKNIETPQQKRRRYALRHKIRGHGFKVSARKRVVHVPHTLIDYLSTHKAGEFVNELVALGYNIQTFIWHG